MEKHYRTLVKTLLYRVLSTCITIGGVYLFSRDLAESVTLGIGINCAKMAFYYFYERAWNRIDFGRMAPPPPEYTI
jgi:uncharacterized membrane protein